MRLEIPGLTGLLCFTSSLLAGAKDDPLRLTPHEHRNSKQPVEVVFRGGEPAIVVVAFAGLNQKGTLEVRDEQGKLVGRDKGTGIVLVHWTPVSTARYTIRASSTTSYLRTN